MLHMQSQSLLTQQAEYILVIQTQERVHKRNFIQLVSVVLLVLCSLQSSHSNVATLHTQTDLFASYNAFSNIKKTLDKQARMSKKRVFVQATDLSFSQQTGSIHRLS